MKMNFSSEPNFDGHGCLVVQSHITETPKETLNSPSPQVTTLKIHL